MVAQMERGTIIPAGSKRKVSKSAHKAYPEEKRASATHIAIRHFSSTSKRRFYLVAAHVMSAGKPALGHSTAGE
jgi:hypothetical protein